MLIPTDQRARPGAARWRGAGAALVALLLPAAGAAQEVSGTVRGRATTVAGAPAPDVLVRAQSASLTLARESTTDPAGYYLFPNLPPGDYVLTFEHDEFVTVRRVTRVPPAVTVIADATLPEGPTAADVISVALDGDRFPRSPGISDIWARETLGRLPIEGGLYSALTLASGPPPEDSGGHLLLIDGAPIRHGAAGDRLLLDPGPAAVQQVSVRTGAIDAGVSRFTTGAAGLVLRHGGDRVTGAVTASATGADRMADAASRASGARGAGRDLDAGIGVPLDGRRTWAFAAGGQRRDPVALHSRLSGLVTPAVVSEQTWLLKGTHAFDASHRVQAFVLAAGRDRDLALPVGAISAESPGALAGRDEAHVVWSASYAGAPGHRWFVTARATRERWTLTSHDEPRSAGPAVWDLQSASVAGGDGACAGCRLEGRTGTTVRVTAERPATLRGHQHHLTVGGEWSGGTVGGPAPATPSLLVASRFHVDAAGVHPVFTAGGGSWTIARGPMPGLSHASRSLFVSDEWRPSAGLTVHAGLRWDRQRLREGRDPVASRSAFGPRVLAAWRPPAREWTLYGGLARYEADILDLTGERLEPAGQWAPLGSPPLYGGADVPLAVMRDRIAGSLAPTLEWTAGASRPIGDEIFVRADVIWRRRTPLSHADTPVPAFSFAPRIYERASEVDLGNLATRYTALALQGGYELGLRSHIGARYTWSRLHGATIAAAPFPDAFQPPGDLPGDRRHRLHVWGHVALVEGDDGTLMVTGLHTLSSGTVHAASAWVDAAPWLGLPGPAFAPYFFTGRDLRGGAAARTDIAASYTKPIPGTVRTDLVVRVDVLNLFAKTRVLDPQHFVVAQTALTAPDRFAPFNPFTGTPVQGVHWDFDHRLLESAAAAPQTLSRTYRAAVGIRF